MKEKPQKRKTSNGKWICCKDFPMTDGEDPKKWIHDYKTVSEGLYLDIMKCTGCGDCQAVQPKT
jgi:hypothetical protein